MLTASDASLFSEILSRGIAQVLRRPPSREELQAFLKYLSILIQWNRTHHLTGYRSPAEIIEKLFLDSLLFLPLIGPSGGNLLDLGAGVGIPGLPIRIVEPGVALTLLEARRRRISFLATVVRELGLEGIQVLAGRAESLLRSNPELVAAFDTVVTRAAGPYRSIVPLALAFLKPGGRLVASGPPLQKPTPSLPSGIPYHWQTLQPPGTTIVRRFLLVEKSY